MNFLDDRLKVQKTLPCRDKTLVRIFYIFFNFSVLLLFLFAGKIHKHASSIGVIIIMCVT